MDRTGTTVHGWKVGEPITKWWRGNFIHLYKIRRACAQCGTEISMDVTKAAIEGKAKNSGLNVTRCTACRISTPARTGNSRPAATGQKPQPDSVEFKRLQTIIDTMQQEIDCLNEYVRELEAKQKGPW